jgi:hypothetical protein
MQHEFGRDVGERQNRERLDPFPHLHLAFHALLFLAFVVLYTASMNGDVQPADSGEFQIAAITLGIPHPPGYPLFTMLGWLFAQAPFGSPFARVTFLSVVAASSALVVVSMTVETSLRRLIDLGAGDQDAHRRRGGIGLLAGLVAAVALGTSTTFWAQATTTNIRSLTALLTALMLYASARAYATRRRSSLVVFAVAFGLGVGHHVSLIFIGVVLGSYIIQVVWDSVSDASDLPRGRAIAYSLIAFGLTHLVWLYLPLRDAAGAAFAPGNLTTLDGLAAHIFARGFAGDMLAFAAPEFLSNRLALLPTLFEFQFSPPVLLAMALATLILLAWGADVALAWLVAFALHLFITITYRAPQTVEYALPCWVIACVLLGAGLGALAGRASRRWRGVVRGARAWAGTPMDAQTRGREHARLALSGVALTLVLAFALRDGLARWPSFLELGADRGTRAGADAVLRAVRPDAAILAQWHQATPMWALQRVEGLQPAADVEYVFPRGAQPYAETFARNASARAAERPTYITSFFEDELGAQRLEPFPVAGAPAWRLGPDAGEHGRETSGVTFDGRIRVAFPPDLDDHTVEAGQIVPVDVSWSVAGQPKPGDSLTVRVLRPGGRLAANADLRIPMGLDAGQFHSRRLALGLPLDLPPGRYDVRIGAYQATESGLTHHTDDAGREFVPLAQLIVLPASHRPATQRPLEVMASATNGDGPRLIGVDYDTGLPGRLRAWTHWRLGARPLAVTLIDSAGRPLAPARDVPQATAPDRTDFLSLPFDIPVTRDVRISPANTALPGYAEGERYVPFGNQMALVGADARRDGGSVKADLHWLAARPITDDYIVSVRLDGDGAFHAHDSVPALGAVPTLKWIAGSRVMDRHPFDLGDYRGPLLGSVVVYDSVSQSILPPLDERYEGRVTFPLP